MNFENHYYSFPMIQIIFSFIFLNKQQSAYIKKGASFRTTQRIRREKCHFSTLLLHLTEVEFDHIACWILLFTYILCLQKVLIPINWLQCSILVCFALIGVHINLQEIAAQNLHHQHFQRHNNRINKRKCSMHEN